MESISGIRGTEVCRICECQLGNVILSLGKQPLSNKLLSEKELNDFQGFPLDFRFCALCGLGQIGEFVSPSIIFHDYAYFSSTSNEWLQHSRNFAHNAIKKLGLKSGDLVLEVASNDGYLLKHFKELGFSVLGVEPARNVALVAIDSGIETESKFFTADYAIDLIDRNIIPKLVIANNVLAHVPDINDFFKGLSILAKHGATISIEAPDLLTMLRKNLFDTIYHEHFSYISAHAVNVLCLKENLSLFHVESIPTHGGSNRFWIRDLSHRQDNSNLSNVLTAEIMHGLFNQNLMDDFAANSTSAINGFKSWCENQAVAPIGFGAAAKATVLLNASNIQSHEFQFIVDSSPHKQNRFVPGVNIPIKSPNELKSSNQGSIVIFAWNLAKEIMIQIEDLIGHSSREVITAIPEIARVEFVKSS